MPRTKSYLVNEAQSLGIELDGSEKTATLMNLIRDVKLAGQDIIQDQFEPMSAKDCKIYFDYDLPVPWQSTAMQKNVWEREGLIAEPKFDGVRMKAHLVGGGKYRFDSRGRSDVSYEYVESTENYPQFEQNTYDAELDDTILDGEFVMPVDNIDTGSVITKGTLTTTMAITGSLPAHAIALQRKYGWCEYHVFDVIKVSGVSLIDKPWLERRLILERVVRQLDCPFIKISPVFTANDIIFNALVFEGMRHLAFTPSLADKFLAVVQSGGEGLMLKDIYEPYRIGKRSWAWMKLKRFETVEGFITGFIPGKGALEGLVGAFRVSALLPDGEPFEFASVGQMELDFRREISYDDGTLKPEYYGKVIEVQFQQRTVTDRLRHAVLFRWRPDKSAEECTLS